MLPLLPLVALYAQAPVSSPVVVVIAEPNEVRPGESVLLTWVCPRSPQVRLEPGGMILPGRSQVTLRPAYTTTYRLFDAGPGAEPGGAELGHAEVRVTPGLPLGEAARICAFDASAKAVLPGDPVVLKWECAGSAKVRLEPGGLELDGKSEVTVTPLESTRYTITANNAAGGQSRTLEVAVLGHQALALAKAARTPTASVCSFEASRTVVKPGEQVDLKWVLESAAALEETWPGQGSAIECLTKEFSIKPKKARDRVRYAIASGPARERC